LCGKPERSHAHLVKSRSLSLSSTTWLRFEIYGGRRANQFRASLPLLE
jgi:hypothetical protein